MFMHLLLTPAENAEYDATRRMDEMDLQCQVLHQLLVLGVDLVCLTRQQVENNAAALVRQVNLGTAPPPDLIIPYERLARAIHRTVLLQARILAPEAAPAPAPPPVPSQSPTHEPAAPAEPKAPTETPPATEAAAPQGCTTPTRPERLERLDLRDLTDDIEHRPIPEIIAAIRRDFQLVLDPAPPGEPPDPLPRPARRRPCSSRFSDYDDDPEDDTIWEDGLARPPRPPNTG
jgi:hypothetical protein